MQKVLKCTICNNLIISVFHTGELIKFTWFYYYYYYYLFLLLFSQNYRTWKWKPSWTLRFTVALLLVGSMPNNSSCQQEKPYQLLALNDHEPLWIAAVRSWTLHLCTWNWEFLVSDWKTPICSFWLFKLLCTCEPAIQPGGKELYSVGAAHCLPG